jgi:starch phosphorylase
MAKKQVAYFSMEIAISNDIYTYSGGLGVLAGDSLRSSADMGLPVVGVTLVSRKGHFRQELTRDGRQVEHPSPWDPSKRMSLLPNEVRVGIQGRDVRVKAWLHTMKSPTGGSVPVYLLDTDVEGNAPEDREITSYLYGGDERYRLKQEMVLGIGGARMLDALGIQVRKYHLNEGHASLLTLELLRKHEWSVEKVKSLCVFTTHTTVEAGNDKFPHSLVGEVLGEFVPDDLLKRLGGEGSLNMTLLALNLSDYVNGVAKRHGEVSKQLFPSYEVHAITNGIHPYTWTCESFRRLYDKHFPGWAYEPESLVRADEMPAEEVWEAHRDAKVRLIDYVNRANSADMDYDALTIGFARRVTEYKRANLLFSDLGRLKKIGRKSPLQVVFAGKAHPQDFYGKKMIEEIFGHIGALRDEIKIAYLENYDMEIAARLVPGVDVWLNTPSPPKEASGTSGMKAAFNGVINFSVLDGWWIEGWLENVTGWAIGPHPKEQVSQRERREREIEDLYDKLEYVIVPKYYYERDAWIRTMKSSIEKIPFFFNSHRMVRRYVVEAYF